MTTTATPVSPELRKPLAGLIFVLGWAVAIVAWSLVHIIPDFAARGFVADVGIVFASIGFAALFITTLAQLRTAIILGVIGIALFAFGGFLHITVIVYALRILGPFLALMTPVFKLSNGFRIFA